MEGKQVGGIRATFTKKRLLREQTTPRLKQVKQKLSLRDINGILRDLQTTINHMV
jgi:hypothetical protein